MSQAPAASSSKPSPISCDLRGDLEANEQREQSNSFDESRRDDHRGLDAAGHFRLASHALQGAGGQFADAVTGPHDDQSSADVPRIENTPARLGKRGSGGGNRHKRSTQQNLGN